MTTRSLSPLPWRTVSWLRFEIDVLDAEPAALHEAQPGAVHQAGHQAVGLGGRQPVEGVEQLADLVAREDDRQPPAAAGANGVEGAEVEVEHVAVEEEQGGEGLVLGARRDVLVDGEVGEEPLDLGGAQVLGWRKPSGRLWKRTYCSTQRT